jgi:hypothetical protein
LDGTSDSYAYADGCGTDDKGNAKADTIRVTMMKTLSLITVLLLATPAFAQAPGAQATPSISDLDQQLQEVGCRAERQTAAQTIVQLRAQIDALQKQVNAKDPPPKSGGTKH